MYTQNRTKSILSVYVGYRACFGWAEVLTERASWEWLREGGRWGKAARKKKGVGKEV